MSFMTSLSEDGRYDIVVDAPPVNAFSIAMLKELTAALRALPEEAVVVVLRATGRGFCGGGDVKEVQALPGFEGILGQARSGLDLCHAIQECRVPVIAGVHGYCIGVGVLIVGVCDVLVAARDTAFVLAEADNGAANGVIQALGLLPEKRMRSAMLTCEPFSAEELHRYGSVYALTDADGLVAATNRVAGLIARKSPRVVQALKQSMNRSADRDLVTKARAELSYTYELNMLGDAREARATFVDGSRGSYVPRLR